MKIKYRNAKAGYVHIGFTLAFFMAAIFHTSAQQVQTLKGKIIDGQTQKPVPFATVKVVLHRGATGCISNSEGDFQLPAAYRTDADTLIISCIGYQAKKVMTARLSIDNINVITLEPSEYSLPEVVVEGGRRKQISAPRLVQLAIKNIDNNYPSTPHSYIAYYRDYQRRENEYINLNEAIVEVFDNGFSTNDQRDTRIGLYAYKQNKDFSRDTTTEINYDQAQGLKFIPGAKLYGFGGNELVVLRVHDAIRNNNLFSYSFVNKFKDNFLLNHTFQLEGGVLLNDVALYHISFTSKPAATDPDHFANGTIFIEKNNFAIHKLDYATYERKGDKENMLYTIHVEYARQEKLMQLNYISFHNLFQVKDPYEFKAVDLVYDHGIKAIILTFNNVPDIKTLRDPKHYNFTYNHQEIAIERVEYKARYENQVFVYLKKYLFIKGKIDDPDHGLRGTITGVKDIDGKEINTPTYHTLSQFREIFVQKNTARVPQPDSLCIDKNKPLRKNGVHTYSADNPADYWMNSPLKTALD